MPADLVGFYLSDELTTVAGDWHAINSGGTATATTTTTNGQLNNVAVAPYRERIRNLELQLKQVGEYNGNSSIG